MKFAVRGDASALLPAAPAGDRADAAAPQQIGLRRLFGGAPFASLGAAALGVSAGPPPVKERHTGVEFPGEFCLTEGQRGCPVITGAGVRSKRLAGIKNLDIYALALYVDEGAARGALRSKFRGATLDALAKDQALFDELVRQDGIEKTLRIVITSGMVRRKAFLEALQERLEPPLKQAGELAALEAFTRQFDAATFRKGLEITFTTTHGGSLVTKVDGQQVGSIANTPLAHSLLDIYVGRNPASQGAKDSFGAGLAGMLLA